MTEIGWTKSAEPVVAKRRSGFSFERFKFLIGGVFLLGAIAFLIASGTLTGMRYFITVEELLADPAMVGQTVRITGAVIGESIDYDAQTLDLAFTVAHVPSENPDLGLALHLAVSDPVAARLRVVLENEVKPDLLVNEAQAIMTGVLDSNGVFHAESLLLKCPSRFSDEMPDITGPSVDAVNAEES